MNAIPSRPTRTPLVRAVDLEIGESQEVELCDGEKATVRLLGVEETCDEVLSAVFAARVTVEVNGQPATLNAALYNLPVTVAGVRIDCSITRGSVQNSHMDHWGLDKDARLRLWPADSPLVDPATFVYPARQRWFACGTSMANEPVSPRPNGKLYYHAGLDIGGADEMVEVVSATDGLIVSSGTEALPGCEETPVQPRYDVVYALDDQGWYYRYSHLDSIDPAMRPGETVRMGQKVGMLGKEGASGGWSHLHFEIKSRQPSGRWGTQEAYAFIYEAYQRQYAPRVIAVAQPHHVAWTGGKVVLDGTRSWSAGGQIARYEWTFTDGGRASGPCVERTYDRPGTYSEVLKVIDREGQVGYDFARVMILDRARLSDVADFRKWPLRLHAAYAPTLGLRPGDPVTFKVRAYNTTEGQETWDFGDGSPPVTVQSDGNVDYHAKPGYAVTVHRYSEPGDYLVRVERTDNQGVRAVARLHVRVGGDA